MCIYKYTDTYTYTNTYIHVHRLCDKHAQEHTTPCHGGSASSKQNHINTTLIIGKWSSQFVANNKPNQFHCISARAPSVGRSFPTD